MLFHHHGCSSKIWHPRSPSWTYLDPLSGCPPDEMQPGYGNDPQTTKHTKEDPGSPLQSSQPTCHSVNRPWMQHAQKNQQLMWMQSQSRALASTRPCSRGGRNVGCSHRAEHSEQEASKQNARCDCNWEACSQNRNLCYTQEIKSVLNCGSPHVVLMRFLCIYMYTQPLPSPCPLRACSHCWPAEHVLHWK